jgi:hypothetical protein
MPRQRSYREYYWNLSEEAREQHRAYMRDYQKARYVPKQRVPRTKNKSKNYLISEYVDSKKMELKQCADCQLPCEHWNVIMFAFDHLDPTQKSFALAKAKLQKGDVFKLIDAEIQKCELVCHNCHAYRTWVERAHLGQSVKKCNDLPLLEMMYDTHL